MSLDRIDARRIALIKPSALGDIVHSLPVLTALRARFPAARITWVVNKSYEALLAGHPDLTDTLPFDRGALKGARALGAACAFAGEMRRRRFDLVIGTPGRLIDLFRQQKPAGASTSQDLIVTLPGQILQGVIALAAQPLEPTGAKPQHTDVLG